MPTNINHPRRTRRLPKVHGPATQAALAAKLVEDRWGKVYGDQLVPTRGKAWRHIVMASDVALIPRPKRRKK